MLANTSWGESTLQAGERTLRLRWGWNTVCVLEQDSGKKASEIVEGLFGKRGIDLSPSVLRWYLWGMLQAYQPGLTLLEAGDILDVTGPEAAWSAMVAAVSSGSPREGDAEGEADPNGRRAGGRARKRSGTAAARG